MFLLLERCQNCLAASSSSSSFLRTRLRSVFIFLQEAATTTTCSFSLFFFFLNLNLLCVCWRASVSTFCVSFTSNSRRRKRNLEGWNVHIYELSLTSFLRIPPVTSLLLGSGSQHEGWNAAASVWTLDCDEDAPEAAFFSPNERYRKLNLPKATRTQSCRNQSLN